MLAAHVITESDLIFVLVIVAILVAIFWLFGRFRGRP